MPTENPVNFNYTISASDAGATISNWLQIDKVANGFIVKVSYRTYVFNEINDLFKFMRGLEKQDNE